MTSYSSKAEAAEFAKKIRARLVRPGAWRIHTWENMGWYACLAAANDKFTLYWSSGSDGTDYHALLSEGSTSFCGSYNWHSNRTFRNPNQAVEFTLKLARAYLAKIYVRITEAEQAHTP
jgi:hypothetical protein